MPTDKLSIVSSTLNNCWTQFKLLFFLMSYSQICGLAWLQALLVWTLETSCSLKGRQFVEKHNNRNMGQVIDIQTLNDILRQMKIIAFAKIYCYSSKNPIRLTFLSSTFVYGSVFPFIDIFIDNQQFQLNRPSTQPLFAQIDIISQWWRNAPSIFLMKQ